MKVLLNVTLFLTCIAVIIAGNVHWGNKATNYEGSVGVSEQVGAKEINNKEEGKVDSVKEVSQLTTNLSKKIKEKIVNNNAPIIIEAVGSSATSNEESGWPALLQENLNDTYGEEVFEVNVNSFGDKTSDKVVEEITPTKVDILLLEPFLLKNNGILRIEDSLDLTTIIIKKYKDVNENIEIMLQPSNPLHDAVYYPMQVKELENYARENDYVYLDHWEAWPALDDLEIEEYLTNGSEPNEKGHTVWAEYLTSYFSGK